MIKKMLSVLLGDIGIVLFSQTLFLANGECLDKLVKCYLKTSFVHINYLKAVEMKIDDFFVLLTLVTIILKPVFDLTNHCWKFIASDDEIVS